MANSQRAAQQLRVRASSELSIVCAERLKRDSSERLLLDIGSLSLLPENQGKEARFLYLAEVISSLPQSVTDGAQRFSSARLICEAFDRRLGRQWESYEVDNRYVPYISWVSFDRQVFRVFSGVFSDSELYVKDVLEKFLPLDRLVQEVLGFTVTEFFSFFLPRIERVILESGLEKFESAGPEDFPPQITFDQIGLAEKIREAIVNHFVVDSHQLNPKERQMFNVLSKEVGAYQPDMDRFFSENADLMTHPIVKIGTRYVVPLPQLLLSVIPTRVPGALKDSAMRKATEDAFNDLVQYRLRVSLTEAFGSGAVLENPTVGGEPWCSFSALFDGKVFQFIVVTSPFGDRVNEKIGQSLTNAYRAWDRLASKDSCPIESGSRQLHLPKADLMEPVLFLVFDTLSNVLMAGVPEGTIRKDNVFLLVSARGLEYMLEDTGSPMRFLKFLRVVQRLRRRVREIHSFSPLDLYALFKRPETIQIRDAARIDLMMVDPTAFSSLRLEQIREFRKEHIIALVDGRKRMLRSHYPGVFGEVTEEGGFLFLLPYHPQEVTIQTPPPAGSRDQRSAFFLAFDSLCYHLALQREWLNPLLDSHLPKTRVIRVQFEFVVAEALPVVTRVFRQGEALIVQIQVSPAAGEIFGRRNNDGERLMLREFLTAIGLEDASKENFERVLAPSSERGFQMVAIPVHHKSLEVEVKPIPIFRTDELWVDEVVADAIRASSIRPGKYDKKDDVLSLIVEMFRVANQALEHLVATFDHNDLIARCYEQLEVAYINQERTKLQLATASETDKASDFVKRIADAENEAMKLTFALRHLLETTIKLKPSGSRFLSAEALTELTALSARVVELDFMGDAIHLGIHGGSLEVTEAGYVLYSMPQSEDLHLRHARGELRVYQRRLEGLLSPKEPSSDWIGTLIRRFNNPFKDEFGYSLEDRLELHEALLGGFQTSPRPLRLVDRRVLAEELQRETGKPLNVAQGFLMDMELAAEYLREEIHPSLNFWREARILSRPLVELDDGSGARLIFSRAVVERAYLVFLDRLAAGRLKRREEMKSASFRSEVGRWRDEIGNQFRDEVAALFSGHAWTVDTEVQSVRNIAIPKKVGPIDILAIDKGNALIRVVECKEIAASRNPVDVKTEIDNFFGRGEEPGYFDRLDRKWKWISDHIADAVRHYQLDPGLSWRVEPLMVTSSPLISGYFRQVPAPVMTAGEVARFLQG